MYTRNTDKRIAPTISVPENYGGSTFARSVDTHPAVHAEGTAAQLQSPSSDAAAQNEVRIADTRVTDGVFPAIPIPVTSPPRDAPHDVPRDAQPPPPASNRPCEKKLPKPTPKPPPQNHFMSIGIGTEELLLIGVMALIFFGDKRDDELLICLLLVLLI